LICSNDGKRKEKETLQLKIISKFPSIVIFFGITEYQMDQEEEMKLSGGQTFNTKC